jgi:hypothetical protein
MLAGTNPWLMPGERARIACSINNLCNENKASQKEHRPRMGFRYTRQLCLGELMLIVIYFIYYAKNLDDISGNEE